jgi:hypothetical protein
MHVVFCRESETYSRHTVKYVEELDRYLFVCVLQVMLQTLSWSGHSVRERTIVCPEGLQCIWDAMHRITPVDVNRYPSRVTDVSVRHTMLSVVIYELERNWFRPNEIAFAGGNERILSEDTRCLSRHAADTSLGQYCHMSMLWTVYLSSVTVLV